MTDTELDWTFEAIPSDSAPAQPAAGPASQSPRRSRAPLPEPAVAGRRRWVWLVSAASLVGLAALGLYLVYWVGWQRVRGQILREIVYEDQQSLARNVDAVLALQSAGDQAWLDRRAMETRLGLAAPLPADNLLPVPGPARLISVAAPAPDLIEATVARTYADSAGQTYDFELVERFHNLGPGQWERLPVGGDDLGTSTVWAGQRLTVTFPLADRAWMATALPKIDRYLSEACADWRCPAELAIPVEFTGKLAELARLSLAQRPAGKDAISGGYPIAFDLPFHTPRYPQRVLFPSPHLAGYPRDASASEALIRALTTQLLGQIASDLANAYRSQSGYYLDALIARAEIRLGLSAEPRPVISPADFLSPDQLWNGRSDGASVFRSPDPVPRLQALLFLNSVMGDRPASADADLLLNFRWRRDLPNWLAQSLQVDGQAEIDRWVTETTAGFAASAPPRWQELEGLAYTCLDGAWLVRGGRPQPVVLNPSDSWLVLQAVSVDGRWLAALVSLPNGPQLQLFDLAQQTAEVITARNDWPLGWSATGQLVYLDRSATGPQSETMARLMLYDPATRSHVLASERPVVPPWGYVLAWSADHMELAVTVVTNPGQPEFTTAPAVLSFAPPVHLLLPGQPGHSPVLSPDGRWLAYASGLNPWQLEPDSQAHLEFYDLETKTTYQVLAAEALDAGFDKLSSLIWSPDGSWLTFVAGQAESQRLYALKLDRLAPVANADLRELQVPTQNLFPIGFSADSRYLAAYVYLADHMQLVVYDLQAEQSQSFENNGLLSAWSPTGHLLAVAGPGGLYVADPSSGEVQWIASGTCSSPAWYPLPSAE